MEKNSLRIQLVRKIFVTFSRKILMVGGGAEKSPRHDSQSSIYTLDQTS